MIHIFQLNIFKLKSPCEIRTYGQEKFEILNDTVAGPQEINLQNSRLENTILNLQAHRNV